MISPASSLAHHTRPLNVCFPGHGNMAVSSSIGSNLFDILVCTIIFRLASCRIECANACWLFPAFILGDNDLSVNILHANSITLCNMLCLQTFWSSLCYVGTFDPKTTHGRYVFAHKGGAASALAGLRNLSRHQCSGLECIWEESTYDWSYCVFVSQK